MLVAPIAAVGLVAATCWVPAGAHAATPTRVTATITNSRIVLAPSYVPAGTVVITVVNRTKDRRDFGVGARRTGAIAARHSERLTVTLSGSDARLFSSVAAAGSRHLTGGSRRLTAALHLYEPCGASARTVQVRIDAAAGGLTLSPTKVPCGTVTFDVTDLDSPNTRLLVSAGAPPRSGLTTQLNPGGTATLTIRFPAATIAHCGAVQVGVDGILAAVGNGSLTVG
ncbi:MAG TPA: hypothetical protein VNF73_16575 [Candidatus Saccharimonadales bacterium]|nr:hypothetical protein [Candidatus Saccharimonadales bacterium]